MKSAEVRQRPRRSSADFDIEKWDHLANWDDLTAERVNTLLDGASDARAFAIIWPNVQQAASEFWDAQKKDDELSRATTWHHLVMSVGNFKRQGGAISLFELPDHLATTMIDGTPLESCKVLVRSGDSGITSTIDVRAEDSATWRQLDKVDGLAVATSTTILSALWRDQHFVIDVRDLNAAIALDFANAQELGVDQKSQRNVRTTWNRYEWLRGKLLSKTSELQETDPAITLVHLERSLYLLDQQVERPRTGCPPFTYQQYVDALDETLRSL